MRWASFFARTWWRSRLMYLRGDRLEKTMRPLALLILILAIISACMKETTPSAVEALEVKAAVDSLWAGYLTPRIGRTRLPSARSSRRTPRSSSPMRPRCAGGTRSRRCSPRSTPTSIRLDCGSSPTRRGFRARSRFRAGRSRRVFSRRELRRRSTAALCWSRSREATAAGKSDVWPRSPIRRSDAVGEVAPGR